MKYRAVGSRCAVVLKDLNLPISDEEAKLILFRKGFAMLKVDIMKLARRCMGGASQYRRGARPSEAPAVVDCSSFVKWLYGKRGIWLPRRSIQQCELGDAINNVRNIIEGDLVFVSGFINYYRNDPVNGVGHVGIATGNKTVIHAACKKVNVIETPIAEFVGNNKFRYARRYVPKNAEVLTLETPFNREVETADDIKWIILQSLSGHQRESLCTRVEIPSMQ